MPTEFLNSNFKGENGQYKPQISDTRLTHDQMTYNLNLVGQTVAGYKVMGSGPNGALDAVNDTEKVLKLYKVTSEDSYLLNAGSSVGDLVWVPSLDGAGTGTGTGTGTGAGTGTGTGSSEQSESIEGRLQALQSMSSSIENYVSSTIAITTASIDGVISSINTSLDLVGPSMDARIDPIGPSIELRID